jgi:hypothetical protein
MLTIFDLFLFLLFLKYNFKHHTQLSITCVQNGTSKMQSMPLQKVAVQERKICIHKQETTREESLPHQYISKHACCTHARSLARSLTLLHLHTEHIIKMGGHFLLKAQYPLF